jgi:hypothetical protein
MTCRGFQFEVGKTYKHEGAVEPCSSGFHACESPFAVWGYYPICDDTGKMRRFALVECAEAKTDGDKLACASITIKAELTLPDFIQRGVDWILAKVDFTNTAATNTGYRSAATNTGYRSAATNTGNRSAATNTGNWSAATNTGNWSAATNTGDRSAAAAMGHNSVAMASGYQGCAMAADRSAIFLCERCSTGEIISVFAGIVGRDGLKAETWYRLEDGKPVEC